MSDGSRGTIRIIVRNSLSEARTVVLEPWSGQYTLPANHAYEIVAYGDLSLPIELELFDDQLIVHSLDSAGAMLRIFANGIEIVRSE